MGAIDYYMSEIYGTGFGTTETTIPEADDQKALVDDQKAAAAVSESGKKKTPMLLAVAMIAIFAFVLGVLK